MYCCKQRTRHHGAATGESFVLVAHKVRPTVMDAFLAPGPIAGAFERYRVRELKVQVLKVQVHATFGRHRDGGSTSGYVVVSQLRGLMEALGHHECSDTMLRMLSARLDLKGDGQIAYEIFESWYVPRQL